MTATELLVWGIVAHLVADWLLQNEWIAENRADFGHPASMVHMYAHFFVTSFVFPIYVAAPIAVLHGAIDTRKPLQWWAKFYKQTTDPANPVSLHVAIWTDQVAHIAVLAIAALLAS